MEYRRKKGDDEDILDLFKAAWGNCDGSDEGLKNVVTRVLAYEKNWKLDLNEIAGLTVAVTGYLIRIEKLGMKEALKELMK